MLFISSPARSFRRRRRGRRQLHGHDFGGRQFARRKSEVSFNSTARREPARRWMPPTYQNLSTVLTWAQGGNFLPSPTFTALPPSLVQPQAFAAANFANWITSDMAGLSALTSRVSSSDAGTSSGQVLPTLWPLPSAMLSLTATRQSGIVHAFHQCPDHSSADAAVPAADGPNFAGHEPDRLHESGSTGPGRHASISRLRNCR